MEEQCECEQTQENGHKKSESGWGEAAEKKARKQKTQRTEGNDCVSVWNVDFFLFLGGRVIKSAVKLLLHR